MTSQLQSLINSLRDELQQYGEMLVLLDQPQDTSRALGVDTLLPAPAALQAPIATVLSARQRRQQCQTELALALDRAGGTSLGRLVASLPAPYRPLIWALVQENNDLLARIRHRAQQNQLWLQRSAEAMQQFIARLEPQSLSVEETEEEQEVLTGPASCGLYEAIA